MKRQTEQDMIRAIAKTAELGGVGNDQSFEQSLASMANAYLREKAPSLEPYMLGFQVLDRSDDGKKALGVTGFSIGKTTVLAPIFWLNGELKGHEIMALPEFDLCLPLKENWLNHMLQRKPPMIGDPISRADVTRQAKQPDLRRLTRAPYKTGIQIPHWAAEGAEMLKRAMYSAPPARETSLLLDFIRDTGRPAFDAFQRINNFLPKTAELAVQVHGDAIVEALAFAKSKPPKTAELLTKDESTEKKSYKPKVRVVTYQQSLDSLVPMDLSEKEKSTLIQDGIVVSDSRSDDETSKAYTMNVNRIFNPTCGGLFDVITRNRGIVKCLIIDGPFTTKGRSKEMMVIDMDGASPRDSIQSEPSAIWCTNQYSDEDHRSALQDLPELGSLDPDTSTVLVSETGLGTVDFNADGVVGSDTGEQLYTFHGYGDHSRDYALKSKNRLENSRDVSYSSRMIVEPKASKGAPFRVIDGTLYVSPDVKKITVNKSWKSRLSLGRSVHLENLFDMSFAKLAVRRDGSGGDSELRISVNGGRSSRPLMPKTALTQLVMHHGLRETTARELIKQAALQRTAMAFVKYASPYLTNIETHGPAWPTETPQGEWQGFGGDNMPVEEPYGVGQRVDMPQESPEERDEINRFHQENTRGIAQQAAEQGQTDVFDASMLMSLCRAMRDDQIIDRYIPALAKAMDATARLLIGLYWHRDDFAERFGDKDVPDIEDGLRNLLEGLGDMTLQLKQKTIDPYPETQDLGVNLTDLAGAS